MRRLLALILVTAGCTAMHSAREAGGPGGSQSGSAVSSGLPCDVDAVLGSYCRSCHGSSPSGGAPMSLMTYDDLMAPAVTDPSKRVADLCVSRINDPNAPMPPTPPGPSAAEVATLTAWLAAGAPMGDCVSAVDPLSAAPTCTSNQTWNGGNEGSSHMHPGMACISCHSSTGGEAPRYAIAGTLFPTGHEPDDCNGASGSVTGAQVLITDANGNTITLTPNSAGNFYYGRSVALPYHAKVVANGRTRAMSAAQTSGDCNSCHTQSGDMGAPGRITMP